ncbi:MAG: prolipoprotein diacylglyceryl transferase [Eubacteriales bacterium]|nr:prolipoprotein diacylglyceryl transferase [Eubacteriales bacterium]
MKDFVISPYAVFLVLSFVVPFGVVGKLLKKADIERNIIFYSLFLNAFSIVYGAKLYTMIHSGFRESFFTAGISSLGGVIGLLIGIAIFNQIYRKQSFTFWLSYIVVLPLMYSISKLGCFFVGCCHGIAYDGPFAVCYDNQVVKTEMVFPIQLLESVVFFVVFCVGISLYVQRKQKVMISVVIMLCAICKFGLEYLRQEHVGVVLSMNQMVCIIFFIVAMIYNLKMYSLRCKACAVTD